MVSVIRSATEADAQAITDIYTPIVEETHISFETTPPSIDEMARRIRNTATRLPWLVCENEGRVVGYAYASPHNDRSAYQWSVNTSVYVAKEWQRDGVARGLYESLFELVQLQGLYTAYAVIALPNPPSVAFHESIGFERVGVYRNAGFKDGEWHDVGHWERTLQPHETSPSPPTPLDELRGSADYNTALTTGEAFLRL